VFWIVAGTVTALTSPVATSRHAILSTHALHPLLRPAHLDVRPNMSSTREDEVELARHRSNSTTNGELSENPGRSPTLTDEAERRSGHSGRRPSAQTFAYPQHPLRKPLVEYCTNEWQHSSKWKSQRTTSPDAFEEALESCRDRCLAMLKAPKIRRYLLLYTILFVFSLWLWSSAIWPVWQEQHALSQSLSVQNRLMSGGFFGSNLRPIFPDMIQVKDLDHKYIPKATTPKHPTADNVSRLIFVGDVHGCVDELKALLERVRYDARQDHLITTGDLITKGPDSGGTIDLVRDLGASCVRGNHEDRILLIAQDMNSTLLHRENPVRSGIDTLDEQSFSLSDTPDRAIAASLSAKQIAYLQSCPVILRVGFMKHFAGDLVVVHAGLVPGVSLDRQDPIAVMSMRSIDLDTHIPSKDSRSEGGVHWIKLWNKYQQSLPAQWSLFSSVDSNAQRAQERHTTVIYGHDSKKGLQLQQYSKGIDTGCVKGGKLTALVLSDGGTMQTVQVKCKDYRKRRPLKVEVEDVLKDGRVRRPEERQDE
jgi:Calcineurin-like phosphoesterase